MIGGRPDLLSYRQGGSRDESGKKECGLCRKKKGQIGKDSPEKVVDRQGRRSVETGGGIGRR